MSHEILAMLTIKAPHCEKAESERAALDLVAVLDQSGSMSGDKLEMVKSSMVFAISQLKSDDRLAIVLFESEVSVLFPLKTMDSKNKQEATDLVNSVTAKNMTALAGGLFQGLDLLLQDQEQQQQQEERKPVTSILLFTDGQANQGLSKLEEIIPEMNSRREKLRRTCNVFCFGYGSDHTVEMLKGLANSADGMYYYVENEENIASAFGDCIGGLLSVAAQNLQMKLKTEDGVKIKKVLGSTTKANKSQVKDIEVNSNVFEKEMGDIYSEEERNLVFLLEVSKVEQASEQSRGLLSCQLNGFDVLKGDRLNIEVSCSLVRNHETKMDKEKSMRIDVHRNRLITIQALSSARTLGDQDYLDQARNVLNQAMEELKSSSSSNEALTKAFLQDLKECLNDMESRTSYYGKGKMKMAMYEDSHKYERGCHSRGVYSNSSKMASKAKYEENARRTTVLDQNQIDQAKVLPLAPTRVATTTKDFVVGNRYRKLEQSEFTSSSSSPTGFCEHEWTLFVELPKNSSENIEDLIEKVVFNLHPTFEPSSEEVSGPTVFELTKKGWGVFTVECILHFKTQCNREPFKLYHQLVFEKDAPSVTYHIPF